MTKDQTVMLCKTMLESMTRLNAKDTKRVTDFIGKFYANPAHPSLSLERLERIRHKNLWSARITQGLRAILYHHQNIWTLLYAGQHDEAYTWATQRQVEINARTGALQIVETVETILPQIEQNYQGQSSLFHLHSDDYLLSLGLPPTWLPVLRKIIDEDSLLEILDKLPEAVRERLLKVATGEIVTPPTPANSSGEITENEDTQRQFIVVQSTSDMAKILAAPFASWIGFLHPSQRKLATSRFSGPLKITGSAGTGKTVVALHKARHLARQGKRVLLTSFVTTLCENMTRNLRLLCTFEELDYITVTSVASCAASIVREGNNFPLKIIADNEIRSKIGQYFSPISPLNVEALWLEYKSVIEPGAIQSWPEYRQANRKGRETPLTVQQRQQVWQIFDKIFAELNELNQRTWAGCYRQARELIESGAVPREYNAVIVDEVQDLGPQELLFLAALAGTEPDCLTLIGDGGQRIYQQQYSLKSLGIKVQGRSHILKINYRTTEQIRRFADRLTDPDSDDLDGSRENRTDTVSILRGPEPILKSLHNRRAQTQFILTEIKQALRSGITPNEIGIFARTKGYLQAIESALRDHNIPCLRLENSKDSDISNPEDFVAIHTGSMHRAKGLEFKIVFAVSVEDGIIPLKNSLQEATDSPSLNAALEREKNLLYVTVTRARDLVYVCYCFPPSRYLQEVLTAPGMRSPRNLIH
ncbi:AAA family ATPase [Laspinema sp. D1]|uniref:3'-5' exonuclease n=1 Tax=Laspinema palackyanum TaxID=3231601 RepID=UPI00348F3ADB|nr:AAA family ATPase [Laspinema sp. D2b]